MKEVSEFIQPEEKVFISKTRIPSKSKYPAFRNETKFTNSVIKEN
jgi:hypothetical protein